MYLLDTDICSYFLRGKFNLHQRLLQVAYENLYISRITIAELNVLAHRNTSRNINRSVIDQLARLLNVLEIDEAVWNMFSVVKAKMLNEGKTIGNFDILQACCALTRNLVVVTNNERHYEPTGVRMENWVRPE